MAIGVAAVAVAIVDKRKCQLQTELSKSAKLIFHALIMGHFIKIVIIHILLRCKREREND